MAALVQQIARHHQRGEPAEARAALRALLDAAPTGAKLEKGMGDDRGGFLPARGGIVAFTSDRRDGGAGALFMNSTTGEIVAFAPDSVLPGLLTNEPWLPEAPLFKALAPVEDGQSGLGEGLYDPVTESFPLKARRVLVSPDGKRAYAFDAARCAWRTWEIASRAEGAALEVLPAPPDGCDADRHVTAFLSGDGRWLFAHGWWDLRTGKLRRAGSAPLIPRHVPAASPDGRYVAYFRLRKPAPPDNPYAGIADLVLFDAHRGTETTTTDDSFDTLANDMPLEFLDSPLRLRVTDYGQWVYAVPSLRLLTKGLPNGGKASTQGSSTDPPARATTPLVDDAALRRLLDAHVCRVDSFLVPAAPCLSLLNGADSPPPPK